MDAIPYRRLSGFYFFYLALLGGFMPFWSLYLSQQLDFSPQMIGQLMAITVVSRIVGPSFWGYIADKTGQHLRVVRLCTLLLVVFWCGIYLVKSYWLIALVLLGYSFFQNAILAQFEAVTVAHLGSRRDQYGLIRRWGSLGFIVMVAGLGVLFEGVSLHWLPLILALCTLGCWLVSLSVPHIVPACHAHRHLSLWHIVKRPEVVGFLGAHLLMQLSHAPYYAFYSIFLASHHYSYTGIGGLWALAGLSEMLAFSQMYRILPVLGERRVMVAALLLTALRWWAIGQGVDHPALLIAMQLLNAVSFAAFHAACISLIARHFGVGHQGQGQALYGMLWGLGAALGSFYAGLYWLRVDPALIYSTAALVCLAGVGWLWLMRPTPAVQQVALTATQSVH
jgi:PPP family 3-phenylpropionic acid transporter